MRRQGAWNVLTRREREVMGAQVTGMTNKEVAGCLAVSVNTVKNHITNINRKLGTNTQQERALYVLRHWPWLVTGEPAPPLPPEMLRQALDDDWVLYG